MSFRVGSGCISATVSAACLDRIAHSADKPVMSLWDRIKEIFCSTRKSVVLECLRGIFHPPAGTTEQDVMDRFKLLSELAHDGYKDRIQLRSGDFWGKCFCILDSNGKKMLSVTLDCVGKTCSVKCKGFEKKYDLTTSTEQEGGHAGCVNAHKTHPAATRTPRTVREYEAVWSAWERAAPTGESSLRATAVQKMRNCLNGRALALNLKELGLSTLPDHFPPSMVVLDVSGNNLVRLPRLPPKLQALCVNDNKLTSLPAPSSKLKILYIANNQLTCLPENIADYPCHMNIELSGNPLSEHTRQLLHDISSVEDYAGPGISFGWGDPSATRPPRALSLAVADWLIPESAADKWQAFEKEQDAPSFSRFLDNLGKSINAKTELGFKAQISSWLTQLAEDGALRAKTFDMAVVATSTCDDRITLALNQMKNVQVMRNAEKGLFNCRLPELVSWGRVMFRLDKLEQIAKAKVATLNTAREELEVYLGYQYGLKKALGLASVAPNILYFADSHITNADLRVAECQVKQAENHEFSEWILEWEPLQTVLQQIAPKEWEAACEQRSSAYDDSYERHTKGMTQEELDNTALCCKMGNSAIQESRIAFRDSLRPLRRYWANIWRNDGQASSMIACGMLLAKHECQYSIVPECEVWPGGNSVFLLNRVFRCSGK